ncbi:MAG: tRNA (adenosine(37)-N6)-threonylcarbamoyltransferase complex dimerization subunit type 1 TsaB [Candidatus Korobacteraceae bacterium]|jgi:tRNA threonylcarbamoyladenosine biosynthesis protein TsaB
MIILGIDTSGRDGSVALARGSGERFEVLGLMPLAGRTFSEQLIPAIAALLTGASLAKSAIDLLAVASGPGSFTGLRVGLATVKGLAEALGKPIVAVSLLAATAAASRQTASVVAALDAQRGDVYVGEYQVVHSEMPSELRMHRIDEVLLTLEDFMALLGARIPVPVTCTPDATVERALRQSGSPVEIIPRPQADCIARLGVANYLQGLTISSEALDANYLRRSDAEIFSAPKPVRSPE